MPYFSINLKDLRRQGEISLQNAGRNTSARPEAHLDAGLNLLDGQGWQLREIIGQGDQGPVFIFYKTTASQPTERGEPTRTHR